MQQYRQPDETSTDDKKNGEYQWQNYSYSNDWGDESSSPGACGSTDDPVAIALQEPGRPQMNDQQIREIIGQQYAIHAAMKAQTDLEQRKIVRQIYEDMNSLKQMHMQTQAAPPAATNPPAEIEAEAAIDLTHIDDLGIEPVELPLPPAAPVTPAATPAAPAQSSAELPQLPAAPERESEANAEAGPPTSSDTGYLPAAILQNYNLRQRRKPSRQLTDTERQNKEEQEKAALAAALAENDAATEMLEATPLAADDAEATPGAEAAAAEEPVDTETDPAAPATATDDAAAPADTAAVPDGQFLI